MSEVLLWWIGANAVDSQILHGVTRRVGTEFRVAARLHDGPQRPDGAWDPRRRQHSSTRILEWLVAHRPEAAARIVGLTDADLFIPILTFVFGEAQLNGRAAVVSTARLAAPVVPGTVEPRTPRLAARLEKECVHELGHTFGLLHCAYTGCPMARSASLRHVDAKGATLCRACRATYEDRRPDIAEPVLLDERPAPS